MKGETFPVADEARNCSLMPLHERRPERSGACMAEDAPHSVSCVEGEAGYTAPDKTLVRGAKVSRRKGRRARRQAERLRKRQARVDALGGLNGVFSYHNLYKAGLKCCRNVRWKQSVQRFEARLFSGTAARRRDALYHQFKFSPYVHFLLCERGKIRPIDAPRITDRQVEKVFTQDVLLPLYLPSMIYNNGASLEGKGFAFSQDELKRELRRHFRKYGKSGGIILADGRKFFPSADHGHIYERHERILLDEDLKEFGDAVIRTVKAGVGMPLGVEPSQAEMIAYPSEMDNYMKCQMSLDGYGHYMDDFNALVPPDVDYRAVMGEMRRQSERCRFRFSESKTRYVPLTKPFRYCKTKFFITETGKVVTRANKKAVTRDRRKIKAFKQRIDAGEMSWLDLWTSVNGMLSYLDRYNEHKNILKLRRLFYRLFGFSCENYENFIRRERQDAIRRDQALQEAGEAGAQSRQHPVRQDRGGTQWKPVLRRR